MATIYDVAKIANVSISTVSNYLNNKYISPEKRAVIQKAIEQLNYVPSQSAKRLKTKKSNQIAVILPNVDERLYAETLMGINILLEKAQLKTVLYMTDDKQMSEERAINECLTSEYAGVIICTCSPASSQLFVKLQKRMPVVFIIRKPKRMPAANYIGFKDNETLFNVTNYFLNQGHHDICLMTGPTGFSNEAECLDGYKKAFSKNSIAYNEKNIVQLPLSREAIFNIIIKKIASGFLPKLIITSSQQIANALIEATILRDIKLGSDLNILSLSEGSRYNFESVTHITTTNRPAKKLGMFATDVMLSNIKNPKSFEFISKSFSDDFLYAKLKNINQNLTRFTSVSVKPVYAKTLRLLLTENDNISDTIKYILPQFSNREKVHVVADTLPQTGIYEQLLKVKNKKVSDYDVFAIDVPWLSYFSHNDCLLSLDEHFDKTNLSASFSQNTLKNFGEYNGTVYGIPYLNATQILYFRKDFFEDEKIKQTFKSAFGKPLKVPDNWHDFNLIAKFFTKKYNPDSPFEYGTCINRLFHEAVMGELYPRMWAYGGSVFDRQGRIDLLTDENISAFKNMAESLKYCNPAHHTVSSFEKTKRFAKGEFALIVAYHHHACVFSDEAVSTVQGKIGFGHIPGKTPIQAGWTMGINKYSRNVPSAVEFLRWLLEIQGSLSYTVLGGNSAKESAYSSPDLLKLYPWFELVPESAMMSRPRNTPLINNSFLVTESDVERILADVIYTHIETKIPIDRLLLKANIELKQLYEKNGYKEPSLV